MSFFTRCKVWHEKKLKRTQRCGYTLVVQEIGHAVRPRKLSDMAELIFSQVVLIEVPDKTVDRGRAKLRIPSGKIWKIESAGVGTTNGTLYLQTGKETNPVAILFSTTDKGRYACPLPFWLPENFVGHVINDSTAQAIISITEWDGGKQSTK